MWVRAAVLIAILFSAGCAVPAAGGELAISLVGRSFLQQALGKVVVNLGTSVLMQGVSEALCAPALIADAEFDFAGESEPSGGVLRIQNVPGGTYTLALGVSGGAAMLADGTRYRLEGGLVMLDDVIHVEDGGDANVVVGVVESTEGGIALGSSRGREPLRASFGFDGEGGWDYATIAFDATTSRGPVFEYEWDFGDGAKSIDGPYVTHEFPYEGRYVVTLIVRDELGHQATTWQKIKVDSVFGPKLVDSPTHRCS